MILFRNSSNRSCHSNTSQSTFNIVQYKIMDSSKRTGANKFNMKLGRLRILCVSLVLFFMESIKETSADQSFNKHLLGVQPGRLSFYQLDDNQTFKCLDGSRSIPKEFVNDDFCDCSDASDEPGTSACTNGRFFCANEGYISRLISSAWVNDGICDCCDASDEYNSTVTCENTCGVLGDIHRRELEKHREMADLGSAVRSQYKEQARQKREQNQLLLEQYKRELSDKENAIKKLEEELNADFGPSQVFFPLKGKCYSYTDREYTYTLCPFERTTQESTSGAQTELGRWAGWAGPTENLHSKQKYEGGIQCWNGPARSALINIACGVEDKIISVTEPSRCVYVYDFITPAACPDNDPPEQVNSEAPTIVPIHTEPPPSLELDDDSVDSDHPNYDDHYEGSEHGSQSPDIEKHDEL